MLSVFARASSDELYRVLDGIEECRIAIVDERKQKFERYASSLHDVWELNQRKIEQWSRCIPYMTFVISVLFSLLIRLALLSLAIFVFTVLDSTMKGLEPAKKITNIILACGLGMALIALCCAIIRSIYSSKVRRTIAVQDILEEDYNLVSNHSADVNYYAVVKMALRDFLITTWTDRDRVANRFHVDDNDDDDDEIMQLGESMDSFFATPDDEDDVSE